MHEPRKQTLSNAVRKQKTHRAGGATRRRLCTYDLVCLCFTENCNDYSAHNICAEVASGGKKEKK